MEKGKADEVCYLLIDSGFEIVSVKNITAAVISERNDPPHPEEKSRIGAFISKYLTSNTNNHNSMHLEALDENKEYWSYILRKI